MTETERRIAALLAQGYSYAVVARVIGWQAASVKRQVRVMSERLGMTHGTHRATVIACWLSTHTEVAA